MSVRPQRLFPLVLVVLMGLTTFWLDQISRWIPGGFRLDPAKPEYVAEKFTATRFNENGMLRDRISAQRMWQYPEKPDMYFQRPHLQVFQEGRMQYDVTGETGRYHSKNRQAWFDDRVVFYKPQDEKPETRVLTSRLEVNTATRITRTAAPVEIHYGNSVAHATGLYYDQQAGLLKLLSQVKVVYEK